MNLVKDIERALERGDRRGGCMEALAWMPGVLGLVPRWKNDGAGGREAGQHLRAMVHKARMAKQVRHISQ